MQFMICILIFVLAVDQAAFTKILSRPLIACTLIGAVMSDIKTGMAAGATLELINMTYDQHRTLPQDGYQSSYLLASVAAVVLAVKSGTAESAAASAVLFALLGSYLSHILSIVNTVFVPFARNAAEKRDGKKVGMYNLIAVIIRGIAFAAAAAVIFSAADGLADKLSDLVNSYGWILKSLAAFNILLPCVGFAVLLRNLSVKNMPGVFFAGAACMSLACLYMSFPYALALCAFMAYGIASYDYHSLADQKKQDKSLKGGASKWW